MSGTGAASVGGGADAVFSGGGIKGQTVATALDEPETALSGMVPQAQDGQRLLGLVVVVVGLVAVVAAFALAVLHYSKSSDVSTALAPVTGVVGTIVGAYFGVQVGSQGRAAAEAKRTRADNQAKALAAVAPGEDALRILGSPSEPARG